MSLQNKTFKINGGLTIPAIGFGVGTAWFKRGENNLDNNLVELLKLAIETGVTHIDGAEIYRTNREIGEVILNFDRQKLFITNKFNVGDSSHSKFSDHGNPYDYLKFSLSNELRTDHVDLFLLHTPFIDKSAHGFDLLEAWTYMEKLVEEGYAKSIGVSNFSVSDLKQILANGKIKPAVNQIEFSAYLQNQTPGIVDFCQGEGILLEAYSPLGPLTKGRPGPIDKVVQTLGDKYGKTDSQILLRWVLHRQILPITTSSKIERVKSYLDIFDFELTKEEVDEISSLGKQKTLRQYFSKEYSKYD